MEFANEPKVNGKWKTYVVKPGYVLPSAAQGSWYHTLVGFMFGSHYSVRNDELAATMVDMAIRGGPRNVLLCKEIGLEGRKLLGTTIL